MNRRNAYAIVALFVTAASILCLLLWSRSNHTVDETIVCTRLPRVDVPHKPFLIGDYDRKWGDDIKVLRVYFFKHRTYPVETLNRIIETANEWHKHCRIEFVQTTNIALSQIRVSLTDGGYSSAVGLETENVRYANRATMHLQGIDKIVGEEKFIRAILHEFGHALGLEHELKHPKANIPWNKQAVYDHYKKAERWEPIEVDQNVLAPLEPGNYKIYPEFDETSIMVYAIPKTLTDGVFEIPWPRGLSTSDKVQILKWYPK